MKSRYSAEVVCKQPQSLPHDKGAHLPNGADGSRTHDLSIANAALSQLSYGPEHNYNQENKLCLDHAAFGATCLSTGWAFAMIGFFQFTLCLGHESYCP